METHINRCLLVSLQSYLCLRDHGGCCWHPWNHWRDGLCGPPHHPTAGAFLPRRAQKATFIIHARWISLYTTAWQCALAVRPGSVPQAMETILGCLIPCHIQACVHQSSDVLAETPLTSKHVFWFIMQAGTLRTGSNNVGN